MATTITSIRANEAQPTRASLKLIFLINSIEDNHVQQRSRRGLQLLLISIGFIHHIFPRLSYSCYQILKAPKGAADASNGKSRLMKLKMEWKRADKAWNEETVFSCSVLNIAFYSFLFVFHVKCFTPANWTSTIPRPFIGLMGELPRDFC